jgi:hypothetical protein
MTLVTIKSYRDGVDAELARARLEGAGISSVIADKYLASIQWLYSRAIGGIKVKVDETDVERALAVLAEDRSGDLSHMPQSDYSDASTDLCPKCGSIEFHASRVQRNAAALSLLTSLPLIAWRRHWVCDACGEVWKRSRRGFAATPPETLEAESQVREARSYSVIRLIFAVLLGLAILYYVQLQIRSPQ